MAITLELKPETEERLRLIAKAQGLLFEDYMQMVLEGTAVESVIAPKLYSVLELEGVGAALWQGKDAQDYVNELRDEWDTRL